MFVKRLKKKIQKVEPVVITENKIPDQLTCRHDKYLVTEEKVNCQFACQKGLVVELADTNLISALNYFYKRATLEIKHFQTRSVYKDISREKFGILYYVGRILPSQKFNQKINLSDVCIDLSMSSFCVPLIDKYSPLAYAIMNEIHWYNDDAKHSGNETVMRYIQTIAHIIEGKPIVKSFRDECARCRYLRKKPLMLRWDLNLAIIFILRPPFMPAKSICLGHTIRTLISISELLQKFGLLFFAVVSLGQ